LTDIDLINRHTSSALSVSGEKMWCITKDIHDALSRKLGVAFWKCWKSKLESGNYSVNHLNGITDTATTAENFATHFAKSYTTNTSAGADRLRNKYSR